MASRNKASNGRTKDAAGNKRLAKICRQMGPTLPSENHAATRFFLERKYFGVQKAIAETCREFRRRGQFVDVNRLMKALAKESINKVQ